MTTTVPAYTFGGITRPALILDDTGHIILFGAAADFAATYGLKALYAGLPPGTPYPPITDSLSTPTDTNGGANSVAEGAPAGTTVGITASATSPIGSTTYSLVGDTSHGGFTINATTGVVTVADPTKIDFESSPGHAYTVTVQASDGIVTSTQNFNIAVTDVAPSAPTDINAGANTVTEGAPSGTAVGITAHSTDVNGGAVTYSLTGDTSGGGFKIDANTGVVTVNDATKLDFESSAPGHTYTVTVQTSDGTLTSSQTFTIGVTDVTIGAPTDTNAAANTVVEGAANGSTVGITASAVDPNGPPTTYALIGDSSGGGFTINAATGVVTVADSTRVDFETAAGHAYSVTVQATNGATVTSQSFTIGVTDVAPSTPFDIDASGNSVVEGAAGGTTVGVTAHSTDINGPAVTYSLIGDTSGGGFTINAATGVVTVANSTKIDYETAPGHAYTVTAQASDGTLTSSQTFTIAVTDVAPFTPTDSNASGNFVTEGAPSGTTVGITASSTDINGPAVTYSLIGDTSNGGFAIDPTTGVVTVADSTKIDFESTAPGHSYLINVQASDGTLTSSQIFSIAVNDAAPSQPVDSDAATNAVAEGSAINTTVGVTASSTDVNGGQVTYILTLDSSGGGFKVDATTGVISVADPSKLNYETAPGHAYTVGVVATDGTLPGSGQTFTIGVTDVAPTTPVDSDGAANTVVEGAANGSTVGITASSTDVNGPAVTYSLTGDTSGGGFTINAVTGVVTVADNTKIDFESTAPGHTYTITAQASDGTDTSQQTFTIGVTDVAPSTPVDSDATANSVVEGAAAGTTVGVTASSTDVNGPPVTYSLTGDTSGGGFTINATTGVVTVADPTKIDFESTAPGHSYTVTAQASDGTDVSSQTFTIAVADAPPSTPVDADATTNTVIEGGANGSTVGVTAHSTDINGGAVTYSLTGDTSGGGFTINATTGVVTVADSTKIDFESTAPSHTYTVTAQASDGTDASSQTFTINVTDAPPSTPVDSDGAVNRVAVSSPNGAYVGVTASSTDVNGPAVTYSLTGDTSGGGFAVDPSTGKVTVADSSKILAADPSYDVTVQASDGTDTSQHTFNIAVVLDSAPVVTAGHTLNYTENQAATAIDPALTVTDSDDANLASATVQITGNYVNGEDILGFTNQNGITGTFDGSTGTLTLSGSSSVANYQTALESVTYFDNSDNPSGAPRTVTVIANDGTLDSASVTDTINVTPVNDAPVVTAGHTLNYTENQVATAIDTAITVSDADSANLASATVQITGNYANGQDILGFTNQNGITGSFNAATATLTLTGSSSVANYQTALDSVTYFNNSDNPSGLARTVTVIANDGTANSVAATDTINVTPVNDAPVTTAGGTLNYTENQAATAIDASVTVSDVDNTNLSGATVQITTGYVNGQDILGFTTQNGITGVFNAATGTMTLSGSSSVANYQAALESVTYFNNSDNPSGADRIVTYIANDGAANSNASTSTIHVTPVNDAPVVTATGTLAYTEDQAATAIAPALTVTDADSANLTTATVQISANYVNGEDVLGFTNTASITGSFNAATGTLTLTGTDTVAHYQTALESVTYTDTSENPSTAARTVTFTADDGQAVNHQSAGSNHTITVASVDDAPTVTVPGAQDSVSAHTDFAITGISTNDVDAGSQAVKVSLGTTHGNITLDLSGGATLADATTNGTHSVHITGTLTQVNAALSSVVYHGDAGFTGTDALTVQTNDLGHTGTGGPLTSSVATVDIGVIPKVWFIDNTASAVGADGSQAHPFNSIAAFNAVNDGGASHPQTGDYVYLATGTGVYSEADGIHLLNGQQLVGGGDGLTFPDPLNNANTLTIETAGTRPVIDVTGAGNDAIHLAQDNTIHGFNVATENAAATGIVDNGGTVGTLNISNMDVGVDPDGAGALHGNLGQAISITHGGTAGTMTFGTVNSAGGTTGIALGGPLATSFSATSGTLSGHSVAEFSDNGGSATVSYDGTIGDGTGLSASITNRTAGTVTLSGNINDSNDSGGGIVVSNNSGGTIDFTGSTKTLNTGTSDAVSMTSNTGTTIDFTTSGALGITTTSGTGFSASSGGTVTVTGSSNTISTTSGTALNLSHITVGPNGITFASASTTSAGTGISIDTVSGGAINVNGGSISGATVNGVAINAAQDNISIASSITSTSAGHSVQVTNSGTAAGNTISFSGAITDPGLGINLDNNDQNSGVATVNFSGALNIDSTTHAGFSATNGGTVSATNAANSITTTTGTALNVVNTNIGTSGLTFHDISSNGGTNGIVLNNTGTAGTNGGLTVTGDGSTAGSGGTIQNTDQGAIFSSAKSISLSYMNFTNPNSGNGTTNNIDDSTFNSAAKGGINLSSVSGVTLDHLAINGNGGPGGVQTGITGQNVSNLTLSNSSVVGFGDNVNEGDVRIFDLSGTSNIANDTFGFVPGDASAGDNLVDIRNDTGTLTLNVTGSTFHNNADSTNGADGLAVTSVSNSTVNLNVSNNDFTNLKTAGIDTFARDTSTMNVNITDGGTAGNGNTFTPGSIAMRAVGLNAEDTAHLNFNINRNPTMSGYGGPIVEIFGINSAVINGHVDGNTIANVGTTNRAGSPLDFDIEDNATAAIEASSNTINNAGQDAGIVAFAAGDGGTTNNKASLDLTLASNTINLTGNNLNANTFNDGILLNPGVNANDITTMTANIHNNSVTGITAGDGNVAFVIENSSGNPGSHLYLENFNTDTNTTWNVNNNTPANSTLELNSPASAAIPAGHNGGHTILPSNPNALFSASGGVAALNPTQGETNLSQAELNVAVAAAIANWKAAGLSDDKIAQLEHTTYDVADITSGWLGQSTPGHVTVDVNADGHGWYIDPTPTDNSEFGIALSSTALLTDSTTAAAGHIDLVTVVEHEMGEQLGLSDQFDPSAAGTLMSAFLANGVRELVSSTDVAQANPPEVVSAWTDHLAHSDDSSGGGDNFNFTPPSTATATVVPAIGGAPAPIVPSPGLTAPAGDTFQWADSGLETLLIDKFGGAPAASVAPGTPVVTINHFTNDFDWMSPTTPATDTHTAVVDTAVHDMVAPILPDPHTLAATLPSIGGYIIH